MVAIFLHGVGLFTCVTMLCYLLEEFVNMFTSVSLHVLGYMYYKALLHVSYRVCLNLLHVGLHVCFFTCVTGVYSRVLHGVCLHVLKGFLYMVCGMFTRGILRRNLHACYCTVRQFC